MPRQVDKGFNHVAHQKHEYWISDVTVSRGACIFMTMSH